MALDYVNRYSDLVGSIVDGPFYASKGTVLPYRLGNTQIRLETSYPTTEFVLYINEKHTSTIYSDAQGNVVFSRHLDKGDNEIRLLNLDTGNYITTWVTVREYAIWLAAYAQMLEDVDDNIGDIRDNISIETVTSEDIDNIYGAMLGQYNSFGQDLDSYRNLLQELRLGYRNYGTRYRGLDFAVAEITQIPPFGYARRKWGPNWIVDQSFAKNHRFLERSHTVENSTGNITGVELLRVEPDAISNAVADNLRYNITTNELTWRPGGISGEAREAVDGEMFLPGHTYLVPVWLLGLPTEPYTIIAGVNDYLYMDLDNNGTISIQLVTGLPNPTAAQVAGDINNALNADARYGALYAATAAAYNNKVLLVCPGAINSKIRIEHVPHGGQNAAMDIFGNRRGNVTFDPFPAGAGNGFRVVYIDGTIDINNNATAEYEYDGSVTPPTKRGRWHAPGIGFGAWVDFEDNDIYEMADAGGNVLAVEATPEDMPELPGPWPASTVSAFSLGYESLKTHLGQNMGLWVNVTTDDLPTAGGPIITDNIDISDDLTMGEAYEMPDYWWLEDDTGVSTYIEPSRVNSNKDSPSDPNAAFSLNIVSAVDASIYLLGRPEQWIRPNPGPRGQSFPQRSQGGLYDYEEFDLVWSGWVTNDTNQQLNIIPYVTFNGGTDWHTGTTVNIPADVDGREDPSFFSQNMRIHALLDDMDVMVRLRLSSPFGPGIDAHVDGLSIDVKYITSKYLTNNTVPRTRHRQYHGELLWCWSPVELTLTQKEYLGLPHKSPSTERPFAGCQITTISSTTSTGIGTIEYEYDSLGDVRRLRWNTADSAWGVGLGWVSILGDTEYTLYAPDSSYILVDITRDLLPILAGTPPAATESKSVTITDNSVNQGHPREISPAHSSLDIFDVSEYDTSGMDPLNIKGAVTETDFSGCDLTNMEIVSANPFQYSYVKPNVLPIEDEEIVFSAAAPHTATLTYASDEDATAAILYADGLPVPNTDESGNPVWWFNNANTIEIAAGPPPPTWYFDANATYTFDYNPLYRVTTPVLNLGLIGGFGHAPFGHYPFGHPLSFWHYSWWIDHFTWLRLDSNQDGYQATVPIFINASNGRAYLEKPSDMNKAEATLMVYSSNVGEQIASRYWRFLDDSTVEIDLSQLRTNAQYYLTHNEMRVYESTDLTATLYHRYGLTEADCLAATWNEKERNEAIPMYSIGRGAFDLMRFHQLRLDVTGSARSLDDFRTRSLVLKGLHLREYGADVPGLTNIWSG